jgi:hypothetical protein
MALLRKTLRFSLLDAKKLHCGTLLLAGKSANLDPARKPENSFRKDCQKPGTLFPAEGPGVTELRQKQDETVRSFSLWVWRENAFLWPPWHAPSFRNHLNKREGKIGSGK